MTFKDRFLTPQVARAMLSPLAIVATALGASLAIALSWPFLAIAASGAAGWATRVGVALPRAKSQPGGPSKSALAALSNPWQSFYRDASSTKEQFDQTIANAKKGPLQQRLTQMSARLDLALEKAWTLSSHGHALSQARKRIDVATAMRELEQFEGAANSEIAKRTQSSLQAQIDSAKRIDEITHDAYDRLTLINAHLDEAVAQAAVLSVTAQTPSELSDLDHEVSDIVEEMGALEQALAG